MVAAFVAGTTLFFGSAVAGHKIVEATRQSNDDIYLAESPPNNNDNPFIAIYDKSRNLLTRSRYHPIFTTETLPGVTKTEVVYVTPPAHDPPPDGAPLPWDQRQKEIPTPQPPTSKPESSPTHSPTPTAPGETTPTIAAEPVTPPSAEAPLQLPIIMEPKPSPTPETETITPPTTTETTPPPNPEESEPVPEPVITELEDGTIKKVYGVEEQPNSKVILIKPDGTITTITIDQDGQKTIITQPPEDKL